ncbi:iron chaperone [Shivajiella indica]|uniref:Iron chaperone n=1 Tax=Shivajiella indica TaxID=872115 RepID=A0ABW5BBS7_9BACT
MEKRNFKTIEEYINAFDGETRRILQKIKETVREAAPEATESINYGIPTFKLFGNLVHFAAYKKHIGFYPAPSGMEAFKKEVEPFKTGKGTLQFSLDKPIPYDLISDIVQFRVEENKIKAGKK